MKRMKQGKFLARFYGIDARSAFSHSDGNWFWNLDESPGVYFDRMGCKVFPTEAESSSCLYLMIGPRNTGVRRKDAGMSISDIPGYTELTPPPYSVWGRRLLG